MKGRSEDPPTQGSTPLDEERPSAIDVTGAVDVEFDGDGLLAMTDEGWSLDGERATLKEAATITRTGAPKSLSVPPAKPAVSAPSPSDLSRARTDAPPNANADARPRSVPPPLPATKTSIPPPLPIGATSPSRRPPPLPGPAPGPAATSKTKPAAKAAARAEDSARGTSLVALIEARISTLEGTEDSVGLARAHVELAIAHETFADDTRVEIEAERALEIDGEGAAAHGLMRRRLHDRANLPAMIAHLEHELRVSSSESLTVDLEAERARLLAASGRTDDAREARERALRKDGRHPALLRALEADLLRRAQEDDAAPEAWEALASHLGRMSDAYAGDPSLAAWLHVERAHILEFRVGKLEVARSAFERALSLDPAIGPVRDAFVLHAAAHNDVPKLTTLLAEEASIESDPVRGARLELDAASMVSGILHDDARATLLLELAAARAPTVPSVDRRVLDDLTRLYERASKWPEAARTRRVRLRFFTDERRIAYELRTIAAIEERLGRLEIAASDIARASRLDPSDATLVEELDRLLAAAARDDERLTFWRERAATLATPAARAAALIRAAKIAEGLGRHDDARADLRAAWAAAPGKAEVLDPLSQLMTPLGPQAGSPELRARVDLYAEAARATPDEGRRVAYLEKVALLCEEITGDPTRAARTFEEILRIDPERRGAILGLARTAARIGDARALSKALVDEAKLTASEAEALALRVRAAETLLEVDPARALALVLTVLAEDARHLAALALETRLHERAGRWEQAAASICKRIDAAASTKEKVELWLAHAHIQSTRLKSPRDAVRSLRTARALDPSHPVVPEELLRVLEGSDTARELRRAVAQLADEATSPEERARHLARAAEIDEDALADDVSANATYLEALAATPDDAFIAERRVRVLARRALTTAGDLGPGVFDTDAWTELVTLLESRNAAHGRADSRAILAASLRLVAAKADKTSREALSSIATAFDTKLGRGPHAPSVLRLAEAFATRTNALERARELLTLQGANFHDDVARRGALWQLADLEAWQLSSRESRETYAQLLALSKADHGALEATLRLSLGPARQGDDAARTAAIDALRGLTAARLDDGVHLMHTLRLALLLDAHARDGAGRDDASALQREALARLYDVLLVDPRSVTAATTLADLANRLSDVRAAALAATSLADLAVSPKVRAKYLVDAANLVWNATDDALFGPREARAERATTLLEAALKADPESTVAARRLVRIREDQGDAQAVVDVFQVALTEANDTEAVIFLGSEIARIARESTFGITTAIEAMRKVRETAPAHIPSLLTLSELFVAERAWPEAIDVLETVVARGTEAAPRVTALFALAGLHERVLGRPAEAEDALRRALAIDGVNPRGLRLLVHRLVAKLEEGAEESTRHEIASLLERLADVEREGHVKADVLIELAELRVAMRDLPRAERALVEATATAPDHPRAFARLTRLFRTAGAGGEVEPVAYARALTSLIARGTELGREDARWHAALGHIEAGELQRLRDGVTHLERALALDPTMHNTRFELASAQLGLQAYDLAAKTVLSMLHPTAEPVLAVADPAAPLELLERAFGGERKHEEAIVVSELRTIAGALDDGRREWLRARRLGAFEDHHLPLDRPTLTSQVVPIEGRHVLLELASVLAGIEAKMLRADLAELGISPRERVSRRGGHPTRALLDRLTRALELDDVELVITPQVTRTRVIAHDDPWLLVPPALVDLPEASQLSSLARALARIALGVRWLEELPPAHIEAMLVAAARSVLPGYAEGALDDISRKLVSHYEPIISRETSRKHKQALEKLVPALRAPEGRPLPVDAFIHTLARAELRVSYLLTGDLLATIDELRRLDAELALATESPGQRALGAVLDHPFAGDVARFALTPEATSLRRRVASTWTG